MFRNLKSALWRCPMIYHKPIFEYFSIFAPYIREYIDIRETFSSNFRTQSGVLRQFDRYCVDKNISAPVLDAELVNGWLLTKQGEKQSTRASRVSTLKLFANYLKTIGCTVTWIPRPGYTRNNEKYVPYIFTIEEISRLINTADSLPIAHGSSMIHLVFPAVLRVLYCCGLRISEALVLRVKDIDLLNKFIYIENAKFNKIRRLPISQSLINYLKHYKESNANLIGNDEEAFFFPNANREQYSPRTIYDKFRIVLHQSGIPHREKGPRVHDLRHTFAVHSLTKNIKCGQDIYVTLPVLMTYLGHGKISSTEYYLRLTAEVFPDFLEKSDYVSAIAIPEVVNYEK